MSFAPIAEGGTQVILRFARNPAPATEAMTS